AGSRPFEPKAATPTHAADAPVGERIEERFQPIGTGTGVVINEGRHLAACGPRCGVAGAGRAHARFDDTADRVPLERAHRLDAAGARAVAAHQDLRGPVRRSLGELSDGVDQPDAPAAAW